MAATELVRYDAARKALAEARRVDEVKAVHNKAMAMQLYARQAKDRTLIALATEIRMRAERRAGELLGETEKNKGTRGQGRPKKGGSKKEPPKSAPPTLTDLGVTKKQSSHWQKLADISAKDFEARVKTAVSKAEAAVDPVSSKRKQRSSSGSASSSDSALDSASDSSSGSSSGSPSDSLATRYATKAHKYIINCLNALVSAEKGQFLAVLRAELDQLSEHYPALPAAAETKTKIVVVNGGEPRAEPK
jgi:hypothetical protein